jgi:hypothetical protein
MPRPSACSASTAKNLAEWIREGCLAENGNKNFLLYATGALQKGPRDSHISRFDNGTLCFESLHNRRDSLCIFQDFDVGRASFEEIPSNRRLDAVYRLMASARQHSPKADTMCLRRKGVGTVGYTHAHIFKKTETNPEGILSDGSYCFPLRA